MATLTVTVAVCPASWTLSRLDDLRARLANASASAAGEGAEVESAAESTTNAEIESQNG